MKVHDSNVIKLEYLLSYPTLYSRMKQITDTCLTEISFGEQI